MASKTPEECENKQVIPKNTFEFETFLSQGSISGIDNGPFRENVPFFLHQCAQINSGMSVWSTVLTREENGDSFPLYTIEETVDENSQNPFCRYCVITGWGHHFVSKRTYHFIIPAFDYWEKQWKDEIFELKTHILHGLVHCNGYGHLRLINGHHWESNFLSSTQVMNFWDRLCSTLRTRKISVREGASARLLYGVVNGQSWYRRWGYEFSRGSFGVTVTEAKYKAAIEYLKSLNLNKIVNDPKEKERGAEIRKIVLNCRRATDVELETLSDLLRFMMGMKKPINADAFATLLANRSDHTADDINFVVNEIRTVLNKSQASGVAGGKDCIFGKISLINFVLTAITRLAIGNFAITRLKTKSSNKFKFKIEERFPVPESSSERVAAASARKNSDCELPQKRIKPSVSADDVQAIDKSMEERGDEEVAVLEDFGKNNGMIDLEETNVFYDDILDLCHLVVELYKDSVEAWVRDVLDSKNLVKEWNRDDDEERNLNQLMARKCKGGLYNSVSNSSELGTPGIDFDAKLRHEDVHKMLTLDCICGTKYDDGERLAACYVCKVYQHTRCRGIDDHEAAPVNFLCSSCDAVVVKK